MLSSCVKYILCVEYRIPTKQLCMRNCNNMELKRLLRRRRLEKVLDIYAREAIVRLMELELLRREQIGEAGLIGEAMGEFPVTRLQFTAIALRCW